LLFEVSSALGQAAQKHIAFNHTKVIFGLLAVMRSIAWKYNYGSFKTFEKLKFTLHMFMIIVSMHK
jgi:hypothetical protein